MRCKRGSNMWNAESEQLRLQNLQNGHNAHTHTHTCGYILQYDVCSVVSYGVQRRHTLNDSTVTPSVNNCISLRSMRQFSASPKRQRDNVPELLRHVSVVLSAQLFRVHVSVVASAQLSRVHVSVVASAQLCRVHVSVVASAQLSIVHVSYYDINTWFHVQ